jgi:hypothetical protein
MIRVLTEIIFTHWCRLQIPQNLKGSDVGGKALRLIGFLDFVDRPEFVL